jgi:chromosomal replication initiation ATPase DnaA
MIGRQLPLDLAAPPAFGREDFVAGAPNRAALDWIDSWPLWPARLSILWGPPGSGKSHLAAIWGAKAGATPWQAGEDVHAASLRPLVMDGWPQGLGEADLFHLLNLLPERGGWLLMTAESAPARWNVALPDLRSRLLAAPAVGIGTPDDALLAAVLMKHFSDRQLRVAPGVIDYLTARIERSYAAARAVVAAIDEQALAAQRDITQALARRVLEGLSQQPLL